jgi:hypothetical protein
VLFQLAHVIGGHWPQLVLEAYAALQGQQASVRSIGAALAQSTGAAQAGSPDSQSAVSAISHPHPSTPSAAAPVSPPDASDPAERPGLRREAPLSVQTSVNQSTAEQSKLANQNSKIAGHPSSTLTQQLLTDIRQVFEQTGANRLHTRPLIDRLLLLPNQSYPALNNGKRSAEQWLAAQLRTLGIRPKTLWLNGASAKGYLLNDFPNPIP